MNFKIKLAEKIIKIEHTHNYVKNLCKDFYVSDDTPEDLSVFVTDEDIEEERCITEAKGESYPRPIYEATCIHREIVKGMVKYGIILIHSAVIELDGKAYVFLAKSGVGKSTHIRQWLEEFEGRARVLNGDKPMFRFVDNKLTVYGSPWNGKEHWGINGHSEVGGFCFIERGEKNEIQAASRSEIVGKFFHQVLLPKNQGELALFMSIINKIIDSVPFYTLKCNISHEAARVCYGGMSGNTHKGDI